MGEKPKGAGRSSYDLIDRQTLFEELHLGEGAVLLDLACGAGNYALALSQHIGKRGLVHAVDLWEEGIVRLWEEVSKRKIANVKPILADVSRRLPISDRSVDVCLMATVLHDLVEGNQHEGALGESARVLRPGGTLAVIEFKKIEGPPGPPLLVRLAPEEVERIVAPFGFEPKRVVELGPHNYLSLFVLAPRG